MYYSNRTGKGQRREKETKRLGLYDRANNSNDLMSQVEMVLKVVKICLQGVEVGESEQNLKY